MKPKPTVESTAREIYNGAAGYWNKKKFGSREQKTFDELPPRFQEMYRWFARWHLRQMKKSR